MKHQLKLNLIDSINLLMMTKVNESMQPITLQVVYIEITINSQISN